MIISRALNASLKAQKSFFPKVVGFEGAFCLAYLLDSLGIGWPSGQRDSDAELQEKGRGFDSGVWDY